ncbi:MAG: hypothetical protein KGY99_05570, partial [Phycisphaerae bacterium]|nr:hypothetical protein [Phycisphaerae bacterium]
MWNHHVCVVLCCASACVYGQGASAASFEGLGDLPQGAYVSVATGVSADGTAVVGYSSSEYSSEAFRWTQATGIVGLGAFTGDDSSEACGVSADGSVVVGYTLDDADYTAFRWVAGSGMSSVGDNAKAYAVSGDGDVVVGRSNSKGFRWTADGGMVELSDFDKARGASDDGAVIVGWSEWTYQALRWVAGHNDPDHLGGLASEEPYSKAHAVSGDGSVVVGFSRNSNDKYEAFRWADGDGMTGLGFLSDENAYLDSRAKAVSANGAVVVGHSQNGSGEQRAFVWDAASGMHAVTEVLTDEGVDLAGWTLTEAAGVSHDGGVIVGTGTNPEGDTEAWIATVPEPTTLAVLVPFLS